jgi:glycosyltransferase involved in cell wall biosynthesis
MRFNILYITNLVEFGGGEKSLLTLIKKLDLTKFRPFLLCPSRGRLVEEAENINVEVKIIKFSRLKRYFKAIPYISPLVIIRLVQYLKKEKIGLIHCNSFSAFLLGGIASKMVNIPVVWTCHGWWPAEKLTGFFINRFAGRIIAVSEIVRKKLIGPGFVNPNKVSLIHLGIDLNEFSPTPRGDKIRKEFHLNFGVPVIGMISRFQPIKGHKYFLEAAAKIKQISPQTKFLIVGGRLFDRKGDKNYDKEILNWIKQMNLEGDVILTGFRNDIPEILAAIDMLVLPSLQESFGVVLIEAMAMEKPVVATNVGGPREIIEDNVSGLLIPPQDPSALSEAILSLLKDKEKPRKMGLKGRKRVESKFDSDLQARKIELIYQGLLQK